MVLKKDRSVEESELARGELSWPGPLGLSSGCGGWPPGRGLPAAATRLLGLRSPPPSIPASAAGASDSALPQPISASRLPTPPTSAPGPRPYRSRSRPSRAPPRTSTPTPPPPPPTRRRLAAPPACLYHLFPAPTARPHQSTAALQPDQSPSPPQPIPPRAAPERRGCAPMPSYPDGIRGRPSVSANRIPGKPPMLIKSASC